MDKGMEGKGKVMDGVCWRDQGKGEGSDFNGQYEDITRKGRLSEGIEKKGIGKEGHGSREGMNEWMIREMRNERGCRNGKEWGKRF